MKATFDTSLDTIAKLLTVGIAIVFMAIALYPLCYSTDGLGGSVSILAIFSLIYGISFLYSPRSYEIDETHLIIKRPIGNVVVGRREIKSASKVAKSKLRWSVRTFGVGGLFGYFGKFWNNEFGHMT